MSDDLVIDMVCKVFGGKYKHCVGVLKEINNAFCKVELTRNIKKNEVFSPVKLQKVKKSFIKKYDEPLIVEMPTMEDIKVVEHFPDENPDLLNYIENELDKKEPASTMAVEIEEVAPEPEPDAVIPDPVLEAGEEITENHVIRKTLSMDEANKIEVENLKLREHLATYKHYKIDEIIKELAELRVDYKFLYEEWEAKDAEIIRLTKMLSSNELNVIQ